MMSEPDVLPAGLLCGRAQVRVIEREGVSAGLHMLTNL
uniref:Uncharacterized protein n=1 Tax=Anguilla anguilla TaxID=7936 RepID=A0A0E9V7T1_ANGAN